MDSIFKQVIQYKPHAKTSCDCWNSFYIKKSYVRVKFGSHVPPPPRCKCRCDDPKVKIPINNIADIIEIFTLIWYTSETKEDIITSTEFEETFKFDYEKMFTKQFITNEEKAEMTKSLFSLYNKYLV